MRLPRLIPDAQDDAAKGTDSILLAVYAPLGGDPTFGAYPDGSTVQLLQHPLLSHLVAAARHGLHVAALIDGVDTVTQLVEIPARRPGHLRITSCWKQDMASPQTLAGFLQRAHATHPRSSVVLVIEGPGMGFVPAFDRSAMTVRQLTGDGTRPWRLRGPGPSGIAVTMDSPAPPHDPLTACPVLPAGELPMSTWGLGEALREARRSGMPRLAVLHLNQSFSMAVEVMHTVAPHAEYATGYRDFTYFTAGAGHAWVFEHLARRGTASAAELANWFAGGRGRSPVGGPQRAVGGVVALRRMAEIAKCIDALSDALLAAMRGADPAGRMRVIEAIQQAVAAERPPAEAADAGAWPGRPMAVVDLAALAGGLRAASLPQVSHAAGALESALAGRGRQALPTGGWGQATTPLVPWDAFASDLMLTIHFPDPFRLGVWDWRSPFYLNVHPTPQGPMAQHAIEFLKVTDWVDFLLAYHADAAGPGRPAGAWGFESPDLQPPPSSMVFELQLSIAPSRDDIPVAVVADAAASLERLLHEQLTSPRDAASQVGAAAGSGGRCRTVRHEVVARSVRRGSLVFSIEIFAAVVGGAYAIVGSYKKAKESWLELRPDLVEFMKKVSATLGHPFGPTAVTGVELRLRGSQDLDRELAAFAASCKGPTSEDAGDCN